MEQKTVQKIIKKAGLSVAKRPPVVVIIGHVDHGKTTLLDSIRKTNIVAKEAGGITQSIGAYEINHGGQKITFIDTPGHEAFSSMRSRGASVADLAILIVAADDGVQPQTKESIQILKETKTPFLVAINKIDKPNADVERVKNELMQNEVFLEGYGGNISWQKICAKTGEGINELLDLILLAAEIENLIYDPEAEFAEGFILEAKKSNQRGISASVIIKNGTLKVGDYIATKTVCGKVKLLENFKGEKVSELSPSSPALVVGFDELPLVGENFKAGALDLSQIKSDQRSNGENEIKLYSEASESGKKSLNIIIKADVLGSLEALSQIIRSLPQKDLITNIVNGGVGDITDNDVKLAVSTHSMIVGFKVRASKSVENLAIAKNIVIISSEIIYDLIKNIDDRIEQFYAPATRGELEILVIFNDKKKEKQLIGGKVLCGNIKNKASVKIIRGGLEMGSGKILNLQKGKLDTSEVKTDEECGILFDSDIIIKKGDILKYEISTGEVK